MLQFLTKNLISIAPIGLSLLQVVSFFGVVVGVTLFYFAFKRT